MPIFSFGLMVKDTFLSTRGRFSRYRISAFSKTTSPSCGQSRGGVLFLIRAGASKERVFKRKTKVLFPVNKAPKRKIIRCNFQQFSADSARISLRQLRRTKWLDTGPVIQKQFLRLSFTSATNNKKSYNKQLNVFLSYLDIVINPLHWGEASFCFWSKSDCKLE